MPKLTKAQIEKIVEDYFNVHPRYFIYAGNKIKIQATQFEADTGRIFRGWENGTGPRAHTIDPFDKKAYDKAVKSES